MGVLYLAALLVSLGCMLLLDWRFRLFFWRDPVAAIIVTVVGTRVLPGLGRRGHRRRDLLPR